ncbi:unnamed protein product [Cuscuta europaea]|uniref:Poly(A) RNA polymerase mitochondrial-like central palm domain-containing protein n=1 Tax=Cuscuta europaea TaxID=41803 RepID=A0A9P0YKC6_CUSEU|nr:unnamed protein product [Cuscuta europaea]
MCIFAHPLFLFVVVFLVLINTFFELNLNPLKRWSVFSFLLSDQILNPPARRQQIFMDLASGKMIGIGSAREEDGLYTFDEGTQLNKQALKMNGNGLLDVTLRKVLCTINPSKEDWSKRFQGATVEAYGSFVSDHFTKWGDLDLCIELGGNASATTKMEKQKLLRDVLKALRSRGGYHSFKLIRNARVPILMFHGKHNICFDLSISNWVGQMKSKLMYWINLIDGRFRDMVLLVKEWAKAHNINDSKCGTLNSYSLSLLVIFHFQTCVPPILPPLKEIYPGNISDDLKGVRFIAEKNIEEICAFNINRFMHNWSRVHNQSSLSGLFISFLAKFCDLSSRATKQGINPYTGRWEDIKVNMRWLPNNYPLIIEDPFEQPVNAARSVNSKQLRRITETFQETYNLLLSPNQDPSLLVSSFVGPQVSSFLGASHTGSHSNYSISLQPQFEYRWQNGQLGNLMCAYGQVYGATQGRVQPVIQPSLVGRFEGQATSVNPRPAKAPCVQNPQFNRQNADRISGF